MGSWVLGVRKAMQKLPVLLTVLPALVAAQATVPDGPRGGGTKFSKCGGLFGVGGANRCHDIVIKKLQVQIGAKGTNEDVSVKICSDDQKTCCTTGVLDKTFSDDWSRGSLETWSRSDLGSCRDKKFTIQSGISLELSKKGSTELEVTSLFVEAEADTISVPGSKKQTKERERYACGKYTIGGDPKKGKASPAKTNFCQTDSYEYERVKAINVTIGPDGTDDNVKVEICSNVNSVCCKTPLNSRFSDNWSKNDNEVWSESDLGVCEEMLYKISGVGLSGVSGPKFALSKDGKDNIVVNSIIINTEGVYGKKYKYDCGGFRLESLNGPCVPGVNCRQEKICKKSLVGSPGSRPNSPTRRPTSPSRRPTSPSRRPPASTRRPSFGSGGAAGLSNTLSRTTTARPSLTTQEKVKVLNVTMGDVGTNDDVKVKVCSNADLNCCEVKLSSTFSDDWSKNDVEVWKEKNFGDCKGVLYKVKKTATSNGPRLTLSKPGKDDLKVKKIILETEGKTGIITKYDCGAYNLISPVPKKECGNACVKTNDCKDLSFAAGVSSSSTKRRTSQRIATATTSRGNTQEKVKLLNVTMGNDGTNDDVKVKVCSNVDLNCCEVKLSSTLSDDWSKNDNEIWKEKKFGDCKGVLYNIRKASTTNGPKLTLSKPGKDDLKVNKIILETESKTGATTKYDCGSFNLVSPVAKKECGKACVKTNECKDLSFVGGSLPSLSSSPTTRRTSQRIATAATRPPFRSAGGK